MNNTIYHCLSNHVVYLWQQEVLQVAATTCEKYKQNMNPEQWNMHLDAVLSSAITSASKHMKDWQVTGNEEADWHKVPFIMKLINVCFHRVKSIQGISRTRESCSAGCS